MSIKLALIAVLAFSVASALIIKKDVTIDSDSWGVVLTRFWWKSGGTIEYEITSMSAAAQGQQNMLFVFKYSDWDDLSDPCADSSVAQMAVLEDDFTAPFTDGNTSRLKLPQGGNMVVILASCRLSSEVTFGVKATLLNPGGEQLSADEIPLPIFYDVMTAVWLALLIVWICNWLWVRQKVPLHFCCSGYKVIKIISLLLLLAYYNYEHNTGYQHQGVAITFNIVSILENVLFFTVLLLISSGWGIINNNSLPRRWPVILVLMVAYGISQLLALFVSLLIFGFTTVVLYCAILIVMFLRSSTTSLILIGQIEAATPTPVPTATIAATEPGAAAAAAAPPAPVMITVAATHPMDPLMKEKTIGVIKMMRWFRWIIMGYVFARLVIVILEIFLLQLWVSDFCYQLVDLGCWLCILFVFRLKKEKKNAYYYLESWEDDNSAGMAEISTQPPRTSDYPPPQQQQTQAPPAPEPQAGNLYPSIIPPQPTAPPAMDSYPPPYPPQQSSSQQEPPYSLSI